MKNVISSTELAILDFLWTESPKSIREIAELRYGDSSPKYYATVQSLLLRLEQKGWVYRDRSSRQHLFYPKRDRADFIGRRIQDVANAVCGGSVVALLGQFAKGPQLTEEERDALRRLIDGEDSQ